jgi:DNA-binding MarR family transcriptional regulator
MDTTEILITIRKIVRSINIESKKIQKEYGVSIPQVLCLSYLHASRNFKSTQGEIRQFLNLNSSTASGIIDRLEHKGFLARLPKQGDKRVVNISLTSKGSNLLDRIPSLLHEQLSLKLQSLSESKILQIQESLQILVSLLNIEELQASPMLTIEEPIDENQNK